MAQDWLIWQLADSAFPAGALAHSGGLEAALQHGAVHDSRTLTGFLRASLQQWRRGAGVFVGRAWERPEAFAEIDHDCDLFLNNAVANRASRLQGQAYLAAAARTFPAEALRAKAAAVRRDRLPGHLAPAFGLVGRALGVGRGETERLFLFTSLRGCVSSAVRLGIVGPLEAQRLQAGLVADVPDDAGGGEDLDGPVQTAPLLDLLQSTQNRLYSRLFQS